MTHVGERMKLLNCVWQDVEALAKILASAPRAVSKYRANVPDHLSGHCKMAAGSGLGTRLVPGGSVKVTCVRKMADAAALYCVFYLY